MISCLSAIKKKVKKNPSCCIRVFRLLSPCAHESNSENNKDKHKYNFPSTFLTPASFPLSIRLPVYIHLSVLFIHLSFLCQVPNLLPPLYSRQMARGPCCRMTRYVWLIVALQAFFFVCFPLPGQSAAQVSWWGCMIACYAMVRREKTKTMEGQISVFLCGGGGRTSQATDG